MQRGAGGNATVLLNPFAAASSGGALPGADLSTQLPGPFGPMPAEQLLFLLYTSGTTGRPSMPAARSITRSA